jgi:hypothetical protein
MEKIAKVGWIKRSGSTREGRRAEKTMQKANFKMQNAKGKTKNTHFKM